MSLIPHERIENKIYLIRGKKVMVDHDLAELYGVPTKSLNLAVKRNLNRFPSDFMFQLSEKENTALRFQVETSKQRRGGDAQFRVVFEAIRQLMREEEKPKTPIGFHVR